MFQTESTRRRAVSAGRCRPRGRTGRSGHLASGRGRGKIIVPKNPQPKLRKSAKEQNTDLGAEVGAQAISHLEEVEEK